MNTIFLAFAFFISIITVWSQKQPKDRQSSQVLTEAQILNELFNGSYDKDIRPPVREGTAHTATVVIISIYISRIAWHDHHAEVDLYLRQEWEDTRLASKAGESEGSKEVVVPKTRNIWTPDTFITTGKDTVQQDRSKFVVEPYDGFVRSFEVHTVSVPASYGDKFPFTNSRLFNLRLSSSRYPVEDVAYVWADSPPSIRPVEFSEDSFEGSFGYSEADPHYCNENYTTGAYWCLEVTVLFTGSYAEPLLKIFIPSTILVIASWLHFWLYGSWTVPRSFSAAVPFFLFAALLVFYPQPYLSSEGIGGIQIWFIFCLAITFASFTEYFIVICCGVRRTMHYTNGIINDKTPLSSSQEATDIAYDKKCVKFKENNGVDVFARIVFPIAFIFFVFGFLFVYLP